jgi:hypothetical protein
VFVLPLRAILIGDRLPFNGVIVERICVGHFDALESVELICEDGFTFEGRPDVTLTVEKIAVSSWDITEVCL